MTQNANRDALASQPRAHTAASTELIIGRPKVEASVPLGFAARTRMARKIDQDEQLVTYRGDSHLITFGYTGAGKTAGPMIMNALTWPGSEIIIDPKGDVYAATAAHRRRMGQQVVLLDLSGRLPGSGSFNPLDAIALAGGDTTMQARTAQVAATLPDPREDLFWVQSRARTLTGGICYALDVLPPALRHFGSVYDMFNNDDPVLTIAKALDTDSKRMSRCAFGALAGLLSMPERETRPSVLACVQQPLALWESDFIRRLTDTTSFDLRGFIDGTVETTLYIVPSPARAEAYAPLLRLWFMALSAALMTREQRPARRTLVLCDEAATLGRLDFLVTASCLLRSAGVQMWTFWQNPAQLSVYGHDARTIIDNAGVVQLLGARNQRMAGEFADLVGGITAERIMELGPDDQVVLIDGGSPRELRRVRYFEMPQFSGAVGS